ncbi:MAG TPA: response regulator [Chloroflexota bacterium]
MKPGEAASEAVVPTRPSPASLLLVEDDAAVCDSLREALEYEGFKVATAANGREALVGLRDGLRPSAILLDLMMPVMDGWDFRYEQLRDPALKDIPVLVISASGFSADTIRAHLGNVELIPKPVPYVELLVALGRVCGGATR